MDQEAKQRKRVAEAKYVKANLIRREVKINKKTEPELTKWVESLSVPFQTYVKGLIRDDMKKQETK